MNYQTDMIEPLRVLIACEYTGTVRSEFLALGHDAWSVDLRPSEDGSNRHITNDVREVLDWGWDLLIVAHPPCTRLCNSGVRWLNDPTRMKNPGEDFTNQERAAWPHMSDSDKHAMIWRKLDEGAQLFSDLWNAPVGRVACENPVMHKYAKERIAGYVEPKGDNGQSIQPWQFGDWETKRTCLWLRGLPQLVPTYQTLPDARAGLGLDDDAKPVARVHSMPPGPERNKERSRFFPGVARAMAEQWGGYALQEVAA